MGNDLLRRRRLRPRLDAVWGLRAVPARRRPPGGPAVRRRGARHVRVPDSRGPRLGAQVPLPRRHRGGARPGCGGARGVRVPLFGAGACATGFIVHRTVFPATSSRSSGSARCAPRGAWSYVGSSLPASRRSRKDGVPASCGSCRRPSFPRGAAGAARRRRAIGRRLSRRRGTSHPEQARRSSRSRQDGVSAGAHRRCRRCVPVLRPAVVSAAASAAVPVVAAVCRSAAVAPAVAATSAARPRVPSDAPAARRVAAASRSAHVARSTSRCRPRRPVACASARVTARPFASRVVRR